MPKEKNQHKSAAASDEKFRDFFTTTVADIPAEMVRREEETAEEGAVRAAVRPCKTEAGSAGRDGPGTAYR